MLSANDGAQLDLTQPHVAVAPWPAGAIALPLIDSDDLGFCNYVTAGLLQDREDIYPLR